MQKNTDNARWPENPNTTKLESLNSQIHPPEKSTQNQKSEKPSVCFRSRLTWIINILEVVGEDGIQKKPFAGILC